MINIFICSNDADFHLTFLNQRKRISLMKWLISSRGSNFSCSYNMVPDLKLWPSHGHVNPVCVGPPAQVLLMVSIVNSVVKFIINLRQPILSSILVITHRINNLLNIFWIIIMMGVTYAGSSTIFRHLWMVKSVSLNVCNRWASFLWHLSNTSVMSWKGKANSMRRPYFDWITSW